ncbi:MAG: antirestriction protein ArdA [Buchananella hordeovulneris]|nr:antirestriction protein ArdA [Buchananella hordeovulneris]
MHTFVRPAVWLGCLACYTEGRLVGRWCDAEDAEGVTPEELHVGPTSHEELWCLDLEGFPACSGEFSPETATLWGELYSEVGDEQWGALKAWVEDGACVIDSDGLPERSSFEERYRGCWSSFLDYLNEEIELLQQDWPDEAVRYFDDEAYERDAKYDYTVLDAPGGAVYVLANC